MKIFDITNSTHQRILAEEILRAKKILSEQSQENAPKISAQKLRDWMKSNQDLIKDFSFEGQSLSTIINFLETGRPSQYYLNLLIGRLDLIENIAIDIADFYMAPPKTNNVGDMTYKGAQSWVDNERQAGRTSGLD